MGWIYKFSFSLAASIILYLELVKPHTTPSKRIHPDFEARKYKNSFIKEKTTDLSTCVKWCIPQICFFI